MTEHSWDLDRDAYKIRYFYNSELEKLLKRIRNFVRDNEVRVVSVSIDSEYNVSTHDVVWSAMVNYIGTVKEDDNA